jgi:hypothetical protein
MRVPDLVTHKREREGERVRERERGREGERGGRVGERERCGFLHTYHNPTYYSLRFNTTTRHY